MVSSIVVLPTYNEVDNLPLLAERIMELPNFSLLVVDDNSPDGTGELADGLRFRYPGRIEVLHRPGKLGLGTAYLEGFRLALERRHDEADLLELGALQDRGHDRIGGAGSESDPSRGHASDLL